LDLKNSKPSEFEMVFVNCRITSRKLPRAEGKLPAGPAPVDARFENYVGG